MPVETVPQTQTETETPDSSVSRNGKRIDPAESPTAQMAERRKKNGGGKGLPKIGTAWWITLDDINMPIVVDDADASGVTVTDLTTGEGIKIENAEEWAKASPRVRTEPDEQFTPKPAEQTAPPAPRSAIEVADDMEPKPNPGQQAAEAIIDQFHKEYLPALAEAYLSQETTATPGWISMYEQHRKMLRESRVALVRRMRSCADLLEEVGWNEDDEKSVKGIAKSHEELRATQAAFEHEMIDRVIAPVKACERIIDKYRGDAERRAMNSPMFAGNLLQKVERAIADQPKPSWEMNTGRVRVLKP